MYGLIAVHIYMYIIWKYLPSGRRESMFKKTASLGAYILLKVWRFLLYSCISQTRTHIALRVYSIWGKMQRTWRKCTDKPGTCSWCLYFIPNRVSDSHSFLWTGASEDNIGKHVLEWKGPQNDNLSTLPASSHLAIWPKAKYLIPPGLSGSFSLEFYDSQVKVFIPSLSTSTCHSFNKNVLASPPHQSPSLPPSWWGPDFAFPQLLWTTSMILKSTCWKDL